MTGNNLSGPMQQYTAQASVRAYERVAELLRDLDLDPMTLATMCLQVYAHLHKTNTDPLPSREQTAEFARMTLLTLKEVVYPPTPSETSISMLDLSTRAWRALHNEGIETVEHLNRMIDRDLLRLPNFGKVSLREVRSAVERRAQGNEK